ncbi:hypothetical protein LUZ61_021147 [Rhynchospora tenuis]|uniref:Protein kinase domain-containing protein n=1 Tax=Rhynchospora tenuis TaxID=198213 RepID=A0AAD5W9U6_9POAL|nr:hypothetical protein LUZ61_021147 [Rhynchospora tenuis]
MYKNFETLRYFPDGSTKNCYTLTPVSKGSKYLVRASFYYGNYDNSGALPTFDLYYGVNFWKTIVISEPDVMYFPEIIAIAPENYIQVCLVNTGHGTPFISALELRPLSSTLYEPATSLQSLALYGRMNVGSNVTIVRYPADAHDRLWLSYMQPSWTAISTNTSISGFTFEVPSLVLQTAAVTTTANDTMDLVDNLSRVHHKNLVKLIGYCNDRNQIALVYEHMEEGNLQDWIKGNAWPLPWKKRVRIAYESAQGLEYLHKMCNPPLIHRDVKASNILLSTNLEAKISDFGLVRAFTSTHVTTQVVGTPGYMDPYYASSSQLTEKSDVYSFGVVLLEIITGRSPILHGPHNGQHLTQFVHQRLSKGNIETILDPNMGGQYNINSIWKVADLALRCTDQPAKRPDMTTVVTELKESLELEISYNDISSMVSGDISQVSDYSRNDNQAADVIYGGDVEMAHAGGMQLSDHGPLAR